MVPLLVNKVEPPLFESASETAPDWLVTLRGAALQAQSAPVLAAAAAAAAV